MLAESVEALTEQRSMAYLLGCVQSDPAVMCSESRNKNKNKQLVCASVG